MKTGIELIAEERAEHPKKHGWDNSHDQEHVNGELAKVAATLAVMGTDAVVVDPYDGYGTGKDPWGLESKLEHDDIHRLKVAGALIAAEIDRLLNIVP